MLTGKRYEDVRVLARHANVVGMARAVWDAAQGEYEMQIANAIWAHVRKQCKLWTEGREAGVC